MSPWGRHGLSRVDPGTDRPFSFTVLQDIPVFDRDDRGSNPLGDATAFYPSCLSLTLFSLYWTPHDVQVINAVYCLSVVRWTACCFTSQQWGQ